MGIFGNQHPLHRIVHRRLLLRLAAAALAMAIITTVTVLLVERNRVSDEAVAHVVGRARMFHERFGHLYAKPTAVDPSALREAFLVFHEAMEKSPLGEFVAFRIWRVDGTPLTEVIKDDYGLARQVQEAMAKESAPVLNEGIRSEPMRIGGKRHLRVVFPIKDFSGKTLGIADTLFAFSPETIRAFRRDGIRAGLWIGIAVLLTAAILYPVVLQLTAQLVGFSVRLLDANLDTLETLGNAIAQRDGDTNAHNYRVTILSVRLGEEVGLSPPEMRALIKGAFLHDVGKIGIPDRILLKPGGLDPEEYELMKTHVQHGREILGKSSWLQDALNVVLFHHEKLAGKGYPQGIEGEEIPATARIFAIADVFDALTSKRPYKAAFTFEQAMKILEEGRGTQFDPALLDAFSRIARTVYDRFQGKEGVPREELDGILRRWFREEMDPTRF